MSKQADAIFKDIEELSSPGANFTPEELADEGKCERVRRDSDNFRKVESGFRLLGDLVNGGDPTVIRAGLVNGLNKTHRYLQAEVIVSLLTALGDLGLLYKENPARFADGRNEHAMTLLVKLRERFKDELFWRDK